MRLPLYEILLPVFDNAGKPYPDQRRKRFEGACLQIIGGYSAAPAMIGEWREGTGPAYKDTCTPYYLSCLPAQFKKLLATAHALYPDQIALFAAEIGKAWLSYPAPHKHRWRTDPASDGLIDVCETCGEERA